MPASSSNSPFKSKLTTCESSKNSEEVNIQRKRPSTASRIPIYCATSGSSHKGKNSEEKPDIQRKRPSTASRIPIYRVTSTTRGSSHKGKNSEKQADIQRKRPSTASPLEGFAEDVRDAQSRETGDGSDHGVSIISTLASQAPPIISEASSMDRGNEGAQSREVVGGAVPDLTTLTVANETPTVTNFQGASNFQISNSNITAIGGDATIIRFGDGQLSEDQRNLICDHIATFAALPDINDKLMKHVLTQLITNLPRAEAVFNDYQNNKKTGPCFEGTRVALLREMANWVTGTEESRMYILSGLAGIGKSTVAYTIASRAADLNLLGASFFFSRDEADRNNAKKLFTTIAYQLCVHNEQFAKAIGDVLLTERGSAATTKNPQEQLRLLILDPLRSLVQSRTRPILVVVDALDECDEGDVSAVVAGLSQLVRDLPSFKVILTTRPLPDLDDFWSNQGDHKLFHLQDIEDKVVDGEIRLYLEHNLSLENVRKCFRTRQWCASDEQIDELVCAAGRLFIIASTSVRYILDKSASNPAARMEKLLRSCAQDHSSFKDLDHFYAIILRNVVPANCDDDDIVNRYQSVVGAITFIERPLPVSTLAHIIDMHVEDIRAVLEKLQSVILLGDDDVPRIYHKSFPDYLTDQARCKDPCLRINPKIGHAQIARGCFAITNKHLKYNILGLGDPARFMNNEDGLKEEMITDLKLQDKIPQQLRYACVYWANHLRVSNIENTDLMNGLAKFVDEHTLHWVEVLSLIGSLDSAHRAIRVVLGFLKSTSSNLHQLLSDALRFISKFYEIIQRSALHTYYSALPFSPTDSLLYRRYIQEAEHNICDIEGGPKKWNALVAKLSLVDNVDWDTMRFNIRFSINSVLLSACSHMDEMLKICDAATGTPISTILGRRFAFTDDFSTVAASHPYRNNIITYYNVNGSTKGPKGTMITTSASSKIEKMALSGCRVAAALSDGTVWIWESKNAELICRFDEYNVTGDSESWLQFFRTGTRLAYSSANGIVKLRDGISGRFIADLQCGSNDEFVFSDDGSRIACASHGSSCGLILWDAESGGLVGAVTDVGIRKSIMVCLAISANGSLLATAGSDKDNVTLWSEGRDHLAKIEVLNLEGTQSMAFSHESMLAIGQRSRINVYNTNTHSFISRLPFYGLPVALAFSPDCTRLASVEYGCSDMYLWDMQGIDASSSPSDLEATAVSALALSRDCSRLACGFLDGRVELWETSPTERRIASASHQGDGVRTMEFGPGGMLFASGSKDGTIKLWNGGDGSLHGTLETHYGLREMALSNNVLVTAGSTVALWSLYAPRFIHVLKESRFKTFKVAISDDSSLAAVEEYQILSTVDFKRIVYLIDVMNRITIAEFSHSSLTAIHKLTFLPDNSQLVAQTVTSDFLAFNLINKGITEGPTFEHLIQLSDTPLWRGVPVWPCFANGQYYVAALFPQHQTPVPVLWIPNDIAVDKWTQGSSAIALSCKDGRIIFLQPPTSHLG